LSVPEDTVAQPSEAVVADFATDRLVPGAVKRPATLTDPRARPVCAFTTFTRAVIVVPLDVVVVVTWIPSAHIGVPTANVNDRVAVRCGHVESTTRTVNDDDPATSGVPEIVPFGASESPAGSDPDAIDHV
jgi:hypothetical protein